MFPGLAVGRKINVIKGKLTVAYDPELWTVKGMNESELKRFCRDFEIKADFSSDFFYDEKGVFALRSDSGLWFLFLLKREG